MSQPVSKPGNDSAGATGTSTESKREKSHREEISSIKKQFEAVGIRKEMTVLELNGSLDYTTRALSEAVGPRGRVILHVSSAKRLEEAKAKFRTLKNLTYLQSELLPLALEDQSIDFSYSRGVMEYLSDPLKLLEQLVRVTKRGGKIVCAELDNSGLSHYPMATHLESQLHQIARELQKSKAWDPNVGRKLFSMFHELGVSEVKVQVFPHHLVYGQSNPVDEEEWDLRLKKLEQLKMHGLLKLDFDLDVFRTELFSFFQNPLRLSYSPLIVVEGVKI